MGLTTTMEKRFDTLPDIVTRHFQLSRDMLGQKSNSTSDLKIKPAATETELNFILDIKVS